MDIPELDTECPDCNNGIRKERVGTNLDEQWLKCYNCDGYGRIPTEFGQKVLDFVIPRIKIKAKVE